jgi:IS4 transposase
MAIKGKDLFQDDGALEKAIRDLEAMEKAYGKMSDRIKSDAKRLERDIKKVAGSSTEARKATREQAAAASALEKSKKSYLMPWVRMPSDWQNSGKQRTSKTGLTA